MARGYRKLGRTSDQRKALLRNQMTNLLYHGKIVTTETRAKEVRRLAEKMIALAVREGNNFDLVKKNKVVTRTDKDGKKIYETVDGKKKAVTDVTEIEVKQDRPSRLHARRQMLQLLYPVTEVPTELKERKKGTKKANLPNKLFDEIAPRYNGDKGTKRPGGYTRMTKIGPRKGDAAMMVILELV